MSGKRPKSIPPLLHGYIRNHAHKIPQIPQEEIDRCRQETLHVGCACGLGDEMHTHDPNYQHPGNIETFTMEEAHYIAVDTVDG